ncbi:hypothetical protein [Comamonas sp. JC664]|uniref:hypothetical protein n=1 Tax=Comamonas sp. JC664 TaxID=2801917 RepID=UPI00360A8605
MLRGALALGGIGVATALVADRLTPLGQLMADWHTGTGERREFTLADGTTVLLDARSAWMCAMPRAGPRCSCAPGP